VTLVDPAPLTEVATREPPDQPAASSTFDARVQEAIDERLAALASPTGDGARLQAALTRATVGGKRFRPRLVEVVHRHLGGDRHEALPAVAAAVELLHTAFVIHDDVIDGDDTRRGRRSVPGAFLDEGLGYGATPTSARRYAVAGAVLTGDLALSAAIQTVAAAPAPAAVVAQLLALVDEALVDSAGGELTDVRLALTDQGASLDDVLRMEERKTAVYSFELPMRAGAVLADADRDLAAGLGEVGRLLGVAFQLRDDLLGVFGDPSRTGKSDVADLREGKCTPLIVHARTTWAWPLIAPHHGNPRIDATDAAVVRRALAACGSKRFVEDLADEHAGAAIIRARALGLPRDLVDWLATVSGAGRAAPP
jgi:geranylgeranyl diphosphate synthase type II